MSTPVPCVLCPMTATRGIYGRTVCAKHGKDAPLAPGVEASEETTSGAVADVMWLNDDEASS